jgi:hypothetical protein
MDLRKKITFRKDISNELFLNYIERDIERYLKSLNREKVVQEVLGFESTWLQSKC